jgi:hypothetical protein
MLTTLTAERVSQLRALPYEQYLQTAEWRQRRNRALARASWRCERPPCTAGQGLEVHHRTYERLGAELDADLEVLCGRCHRAEHVQQFEQSAQGIYLVLVRQALRDHPFDTIADISEHAKQLCAANKVMYDGPTIHRAIGLLTNARVIPITPATCPPYDVYAHPAITAQAAHEILTELGLTAGEVIRTLPDNVLPHETSVLDQIRQLQQAYARRASWEVELDGIFRPRDQVEREEAEAMRADFERAEIRDLLRYYGADQ